MKFIRVQWCEGLAELRSIRLGCKQIVIYLAVLYLSSRCTWTLLKFVRICGLVRTITTHKFGFPCFLALWTSIFPAHVIPWRRPLIVVIYNHHPKRIGV